VRVIPAGDVVPNNILRFYIEFSAPMSRAGALGFLTLVDSAGGNVPNALVAVDANSDLTRFTVFLDPGREMGAGAAPGVAPGAAPTLPTRGGSLDDTPARPMHLGRHYAIVVDAGWRDANGQMLQSSYRHPFRAGPPDDSTIDLRRWRVRAPSAGTRDTLVVTFPHALDYGLILRALGIATAGGRALPGQVTVAPGETEWRFAPRDAWRAGGYDVVVLSVLEDPAGNRVGRSFEAELLDRVDKGAAPDRFTVPFTVR
jgi:hypothetical protein